MIKRFLQRIKNEKRFKQEMNFYKKNKGKVKKCVHQIVSKNVPNIIATIAFNNSQVINQQIICLKRYCLDAYEYIVFDNSDDKIAAKEIEKICDENEVPYFKLPRNSFRKVGGSTSHGIAINFAVRNVISKIQGIKKFLLLDHDIFPFKAFSIEAIMKEQTVYGWLQERENIWYIWPGFFFIEISKYQDVELNFKPSVGGDTGAGNYENLYKHLDKNLMKFAEHKAIMLSPEDSGANNLRQKWEVDIFDNSWLHLVNASDWAKTKNIQKKFELSIKLLNKMPVE